MQAQPVKKASEESPARQASVFISYGSHALLKPLVALITDCGSFTVAGHSHDALESISMMKALRPDVLLCELHLASGIAIDVIRTAHQYRLARVLFVLAGYTSPRMKDLIEKQTGALVLDPAYDCGRICKAIHDALANRT